MKAFCTKVRLIEEVYQFISNLYKSREKGTFYLLSTVMKSSWLRFMQVLLYNSCLNNEPTSQGH